jgi:hypothetical protein
VRAVEERITISPILGIEQFQTASIADCRVRRDAGLDRAARAGNDCKTPGGLTLERRVHQPVDTGEWRRFESETTTVSLDARFRPEELDVDAVGSVPHRTRKAFFDRQPIDERP